MLLSMAVIVFFLYVYFVFVQQFIEHTIITKKQNYKYIL